MGEQQNTKIMHKTFPTKNSLAPSRCSLGNSEVCKKIIGSYNIQDYLPSDSNPQLHILPTYKTNILIPNLLDQKNQQSIDLSQKQSKVWTAQKQGNDELIGKLNQMQKQLENLHEQNNHLKQKNKNLQEQLENLKNLIIEKDNDIKQLKNKETQAFDKYQALNNKFIGLQSQIKQFKYKQSRKKANIRIFCQKYELNLQPKIKHSYTVEVQTSQTQEYSNTVHQIQRNKRINSLPIQQNIMSNKKSDRLNFYQIYQQQKTAQKQTYDPNNELTSRSQVFSSLKKLKKPKFLSNDNPSGITAFRSQLIEQPQKMQNNSNKNNRILGRINGKQNKSQNANTAYIQQQIKYKISKQQLQLCSVDDEDVQHIVSGLLATFK